MSEHREREFEIGRDEAWFANVKRTYDEFQDLSLTAARQSQIHSTNLQNIALQVLQNAVETANQTGKQSIRDAGIESDRKWNIDEVAELVANTSVFQNAIAAAVAKGVANAIQSN